MSREIPPEDYFVAGAPLAAERACYVVRPADRWLLQALREGRSCHVFAPRLMGKTSLMLRAVPQLRERGLAAAVMELAQMGGREGGGDAGRWFYTFAHRVLRELRIKAPLQQWWQERVSLTAAQRLVEFFRDLVLAQSPGQVVVFVDDLDAIEGLAFLADFLVSLRACLAAASSDPEFRRLSFVLLGVTTPSRLAPDPALAPFELSEAVALEDFTLAETLSLAGGLAVDGPRARVLLERVHHWTAGQPYLTQKLCRALARADLHGAGVEEVDRLVGERLLNPAVLRGEPLLGQIAARLADRDRRRAQLLSLYGRVRKGLRVSVDPDSALQDRLRLLGLVVDDGRGRLRLRNRVYAAAFTTRWVNQQLPLELRGLAVAAALVLAIVGTPLWYVEFLPRDHVEVLTQAEVAEDRLQRHHRRLARWPGHRATADRLLAEALTLRSRGAEDLETVLAARERIAALRGYETFADSLPAQYWRRRAAGLALQERRDEALLAALEAHRWGDAEAAALATALAGEDYAWLLGTLRVPAGLESFTFTGPRELALVGANGTVGLYRLEADGVVRAAEFAPQGLLHERLSRSLRVDREAPAGSVTVTLEATQGDPGSWQAWLTSPQGRRWRLNFAVAPMDEPPGNPGQWRATVDAAELSRRGEWRLELAATRLGEVAGLSGWRLEFGDGRGLGGREEEFARLPAVSTTGEASLLVAPAARAVVAVPDPMAGAGSAVVWPLEGGAPLAVIPRMDDLVQSGVAAGGTRLLLRGEAELLVYDVASGERLGGVPLPAESLVSDLALSPDERHVAWVTRNAGRLDLTVLSLQDARVAWRREGLRAAGQTSLALALGTAGSLAVLAEGRRVRLLGEAAEVAAIDLALPQPAAQLVLDPQGDWLATVAADGAAAWYRLPQPGEPRQRLWLAAAGQWRDAPLQTDAAGRVALSMRDGRVQLLRLADGAALTPPLEHGGRSPGVRLSPDGSLLVSHDSTSLRFWSAGAGGPFARDTRRSAAALGPDGGDALLGEWGGGVRIVPAAELADEAPLPSGGIDYLGHTAAVTALVMSADRTLVASGSADGVIRLWSTLSGEPLPYFLRHADGTVRLLAFSPDRESLVSLGVGGAQLWRVADGRRLRTFPAAGQPLAAAFLDTEPPRLALGDTAGNLSLWLADAEEPPLLLRADGAVSALATVGEGRWLVSGDLGGRLQLWDPAAGERVGAAVQLPSPVRAIVVEPGGRRLHVATDRWLHLFEQTDGQLRHAEAVFPPQPLDPASLRLREAGAVPVGLGGPAAPQLRLGVGQAARRADQVLDTAEAWPPRLGLASPQP